MNPEELKSIMSELRLTQRDVSEYLGVHIRTARNWINGSKKMNGCAVGALRCTKYLIRVRTLVKYEMFWKW